MNKKNNPHTRADAGAKNSSRSISCSNNTNHSAYCQSPSDHSTATQRLAILAYLRANKSMTTLEARQQLGICHPAMRVLELRNEDHNITTAWTADIDSTGKIHRVAKYLMGISTQGRSA